MPNNYWNNVNGMGGPSKAPPKPGITGGGKAPMNEKPAFPTATLPGPTQSKDRSGGVRRVENSPKKMGL